MTCAYSDGWFAVESEWFGPDDGRGSGDMPGFVECTGVGERDLAYPLIVVGRCRIFSPYFDGSIECAEGLLVDVDDINGRPPRRFGLYWSKPDRVFRLLPVRDAP